MTNEQIWIAFGLTGQLLFTARFVVQWLSSEREKRSVVPPSFWYFSIGGASMLLTYAIYKQDIVFILGQSSGMFIYVRNLQLIRERTQTQWPDRTRPLRNRRRSCMAAGTSCRSQDAAA